MNNPGILRVRTRVKMRKTIAIILSVAALGLNGWAEDKVDFAKSIQSVLEARCIDCHGPKKQKGDLRLDKKETALAEVIQPGKSGEIVWTFPKDADVAIEFACNVPGHYQSGMVGSVAIDH